MKRPAAEIHALLAAAHPEGIGELVAEAADAANKNGAPRDAVSPVVAGKWLEVARTLRTHADLQMDFLQCLTAVDWLKQGEIHVVYHLYSYVHRHAHVCRLVVPRDAARVPSVTSVWRTADWLEREQYDLFGVVFEGHPDLRRLLMPDDWIGHPMRKDAREPRDYRGMSIQRPNPLELVALHDATRLGVQHEGSKK